MHQRILFSRQLPFGSKRTEEVKSRITTQAKNDLLRAAEFHELTASEFVAVLINQYLYGFNSKLSRAGKRED